MNEENSVQGSEGSTDNSNDSTVVILDNDQYSVIVDHFETYDSDMQDIKADILSLKSDIAMINSSSDNGVVVPEDFYTFISDTSGQTIFFLSIICGLLLGLAFFFGLKDKFL